MDVIRDNSTQIRMIWECPYFRKPLFDDQNFWVFPPTDPPIWPGPRTHPPNLQGGGANERGALGGAARRGMRRVKFNLGDDLGLFRERAH